MKVSFLVLVLFVLVACTTGPTVEGDQNFVRFEAMVDATDATKDGLYIDDYVVDLSQDQIQALDGKRVEISGKVTVIRGIGKDQEGDLIQQGREADTKHIKNPMIEVLD